MMDDGLKVETWPDVNVPLHNPSCHYVIADQVIPGCIRKVPDSLELISPGDAVMAGQLDLSRSDFCTHLQPV